MQRCNVSFSAFVQLELSGKKYNLSMFPRDLFPIGFDFQTFGDFPFIATMKKAYNISGFALNINMECYYYYYY